MKKISLVLSFVFMLVIVTFMSSCGGKKEFKIMFTDYDGSVLYSENVKKGEMPSYPLDEPTRKPDDDYTYTFSEWWPTLEKATEDTIYTAYYSRILKQEYKVTFKNYDGSVLDEVTVKEGEKPKYLGETPTKPHDDTSKFLFTGWDRALEEITGDTTYTASYRSFDLKKYIVAFQYEDESLIDAYEANEGDMAVFNGQTPTKKNDADCKYSFRGWSPALGEVTEDVTYTAKFLAEPLNYTVVINANGGKSLSGNDLESFKTDKLSADQLVYDLVKDNYRFDGWSYNDTLIFNEKGKALVDLDEIEFESNIRITAHYAEEAYVNIDYVAYNGVDNKILKHYKDLPCGTGDPSEFHKWNTVVYLRALINDTYHYRFDGWYENGNLISENKYLYYYLFDKDVELECRFTVKAVNFKILSNNEYSGEIYVNNYSDWCAEFDNEYYYGEEITVAARSKSNFTFLGWYDHGDLITNKEFCTVKAGNYSDLTAKWDYFTIKYDTKPGVENENNPTYYTSKSGTITLAEPTKNAFGFVFTGWSDQYERVITEIDSSRLENIKLTAEYIPDPDFDFNLNNYYTVVKANIPDKGITEITEESFAKCSRLETLLIPASIKIIGKDAFKNCVALEEVYYDGTIEDWLSISFANEYANPMYYSVVLYLLDEDGDIEYNNKKYSLVDDLVIENVTSIGAYQFVGFDGLSSLTIGEDITSIGKDAFAGCETSSLYYDGTIQKWLSIIFGSIYSNPMMTTYNIYFYNSIGTVTHNDKKYNKLTSITTPSYLTSINAYAFAGCNSLATFSATSSSIQSIGDDAFYGCVSLTSVKFSSSLRKIGKEAFAECTSLSNIEISALSSIWSGITKGEDWHKNVLTTKVKFTDTSIDLE